MTSALEEAVGTVSWWGLSPAIDLRLHLPPDPDPAAPVSVLLVGAAEGRHLLLTAARARRGPPRDITLFVSEQSPEAVARQLLFLLLALEAPHRPRPEARAAALLELLGSGSLRASTAALLRGAAGRLRRWVRTEPEPNRGPADISLMKCRDRDALEAVLRRWEEAIPEAIPEAEPAAEPGPGPAAEPGPVPAPGPPGWDRRLRRRLGARYESRAAVADWDLRMALQPRGAPSLSPAEFRRWRESGDAFGGGGATPNPTVLSERRPRADGRVLSPPSFWGDTVTGPFLTFGLEPGDPRSPPRTATEAALAAVAALLGELLGGGTGDTPGETPRDPPGNGDTPRDPHSEGETPRDPPGNSGDPPSEGETPGNPHSEGETPRDPPGDDSDPLGPLAPLPLRIRFLPLGAPPATPARLGGLCRLLVLGWRSLPALTPELSALAAPEAALLLELPTFVPTLRQQGALRARAEAHARGGGWEPWGGPGEPAAHARFRRARPN